MITTMTRLRKFYKKDKIIELKDIAIGDIIKCQDIDSGDFIKDESGNDTFVVTGLPTFDDVLGPILNVSPFPIKFEKEVNKIKETI